MILEDVFVIGMEDLEDKMSAEHGFLLDRTKTHLRAQNDGVLVVLFLVIFEPGKGLGGQYEPEFFRTTLWKNEEEVIEDEIPLIMPRLFMLSHPFLMTMFLGTWFGFFLISVVVLAAACVNPIKSS